MSATADAGLPFVLWRHGFDALSRWRPGLTILNYHRVLADPDPLLPSLPDIARFRRELEWLGRVFDIVPLPEAITALTAGRVRRRALAITFDDGYADNLQHAVPVLAALGLHATFFLTTAFPGGLMWNDQIIEAVRAWPGTILDLEALGLGRWSIATEPNRAHALERVLEQCKYLPQGQRSAVAERLFKEAAPACRSLMLTDAQIRTLHGAGMEIGGHTHSHPILARIDDQTARIEIETNRDRLMALIGEPIRVFAYPNGKPGRDYTRRDVELVRAAGYRAAVSTAPATARRGDDALQLPRYTPWRRSANRYLAQLALVRWQSRRIQA